MATEYAAHVLKLRLPEQEELKNASERCSADPAMLKSIGRTVGQQVRITRQDSPNLVALPPILFPNMLSATIVG